MINSFCFSLSSWFNQDLVFILKGLVDFSDRVFTIFNVFSLSFKSADQAQSLIIFGEGHHIFNSIPLKS